jgi:hypothetical protein
MQAILEYNELNQALEPSANAQMNVVPVYITLESNTTVYCRQHALLFFFA